MNIILLPTISYIVMWKLWVHTGIGEWGKITGMSPLALFFLVAALRKPIKVLWQVAKTWEIMHIDHHKTKFDNIY